ncbi:hypothetical protein [Bradyrhizobium sp.]|uniref:hypothetical protein n=1 Tax=Bradyrhizobium sp. TaxID=376 RepID=UPI003C765A3D
MNFCSMASSAVETRRRAILLPMIPALVAADVLRILPTLSIATGIAAHPHENSSKSAASSGAVSAGMFHKAVNKDFATLRWSSAY